MNGLVIIIQSRSEKDNLEKCLRSLQDISDNIYLIDPFNSGKTYQICRTYKINYLKSGQSNLLSHLNNTVAASEAEYVLFLLSNEYLSAHLRNSLMSMKSKLTCNGYMVNICNNYYGRWMRFSGLYPDYQVRLYKRNSGILTDKGVELKPDPGTADGIEVIPGEMYCIAFNSIRDHIDLINNKTDLLANSLIEKGKRTNSFKLIFKPFCQFFRLFIIKLGFIDGYYGFVYAIISGYSCFLMQVKQKYLFGTTLKK